MACHEIYRTASQFIRHVEQRNDEQHNNLCGRKDAYIKDTCQELRDRAEEELDAWEKGKRGHLADSVTRHVRRAKQDPPDETAVDKPDTDRGKKRTLSSASQPARRVKLNPPELIADASHPQRSIANNCALRDDNGIKPLRLP